MNIITAQGIQKTYANANSALHILQECSLTIRQGELVAITGVSGSGKSTLLAILAGLEKASSGVILWQDKDLAKLDNKTVQDFRNRHCGFVFQAHHLLVELTVLENVMLPLLQLGFSLSQASQQAKNTLETVGLVHRLSHRWAQLSGGERQRTAIARAVVHRPSVVFMDEPTGNLDEKSSQGIQKMLLSLQSQNIAFVVVTHDQDFAQLLHTRYLLHLGKLSRIS